MPKLQHRICLQMFADLFATHGKTEVIDIKTGIVVLA
jgi:hypothetical protein